MNTYVELVRTRLEDRAANLVSRLDELPEAQLRYTMRIFGDCIDEETRATLLKGYSEHLPEAELREIAKNFVPAYTEYAVAELTGKKADGERFDPPFLTQEEYQEMAVREKWPRIVRCAADVPATQLRREIARAGMLFRPYMLSDPGFNEGVLEFSLYYDLLQRLSSLGEEELRETASRIGPKIDLAVKAGATPEGEKILREIRTMAGAAAGLPADPETLLGPPMEKVPREIPREYRLRALRNTLATMTLKDLRLTALTHLDLLTVEETRKIVTPFFAKYPSFYEMPSKGLRELILGIAETVDERAINFFIERFGTGRMAMTKAVDYIVWKLMPEEERIAVLRRDDAEMDSAMMARHLARFLHSRTEKDLSDAGRQIALLTDTRFVADHGSILKRLGTAAEGEGIKRLYDAVTRRAVRMAAQRGGIREATYREIRQAIADAAEIPPRDAEENETEPKEEEGETR